MKQMTFENVEKGIDFIVEKMANEINPQYIAITGNTCSGKTCLAQRLKDEFKKRYSLVNIISMDNYYKDIDNYDFPKDSKGNYLMDVPKAFHCNEFKEDISKLIENSYIYIPNYDMKRNKRLSKDIRVDLGDINIFEGLFTIEYLYSLHNLLTVFVDTDINECLNRRVKRDVSLYNVSEDKVVAKYNEIIVPSFNCYIAPQKELAQYIIKNNKEV